MSVKGIIAPQRVFSIEDLRHRAKRKLPAMIFDYLEGGALDEITLGENTRDFRQLRLGQRIMFDVSRSRRSGPPPQNAHHRVPHGTTGHFPSNGRPSNRSGGRGRGSVFMHSPWSSYSLGDVVNVAKGSVWASVSFGRDPRISSRIHRSCNRARRRCPRRSWRRQCVEQTRARYASRDGIPVAAPLRDLVHAATKSRWLMRTALSARPTMGNYTLDGRRIRFGEMGGFLPSMYNPASTWKDLDKLRSDWRGKIVVKGVMAPEDARRCAEIGVDGVFVSNHGGRQFDSQPSTISTLPSIMEALDGRCEVILDGGVRRGSDVLKALALGASACAVGRPVVLGLTAFGESGPAGSGAP